MPSRSRLTGSATVLGGDIYSHPVLRLGPADLPYIRLVVGAQTPDTPTGCWWLRPPFMGGGDVVGISSSLSGVRGRESAFSGSPLLPREGEGGFAAVGTGQARVGCLSGIAGTIGPHQTGGGAPWIRLSCNRMIPYATMTGAGAGWDPASDRPCAIVTTEGDCRL